MPAESLFLEHTRLHDNESSDEAPQISKLEAMVGSRADTTMAAESKDWKVRTFMIYQR